MTTATVTRTPKKQQVQTSSLHVHITLFVHFLAVTARLRSTISRYTEDVNKRRRNFNVVEIHQPGLMGLLSSQNLGLIKVVMTAKAEREETTTDDSSQTTKTSQELKAEVFHKKNGTQNKKKKGNTFSYPPLKISRPHGKSRMVYQVRSKSRLLADTTR